MGCANAHPTKNKNIPPMVKRKAFVLLPESLRCALAPSASAYSGRLQSSVCIQSSSFRTPESVIPSAAFLPFPACFIQNYEIDALLYHDILQKSSRFLHFLRDFCNFVKRKLQYSAVWKETSKIVSELIGRFVDCIFRK